jgi:hypothetical protein
MPPKKRTRTTRGEGAIQNMTDSDLIAEFRKRFLVYQWYKKEHIEKICNDGNEISDEKYEDFKEYATGKTSYHQEIDSATQDMWKDFIDQN